MSVCGQSHELKKTNPQELSKTSWQYQSYGFRCKHCNKSHRDKPSWHCKICQYDLCDQCYVIPDGVFLRCNTFQHTLTPFYTTHSSFTCDSCRKKLQRNVLAYGCRKCNYDLCEKCYKKVSPGKELKKKLQKLFEKNYADPEEDDIMSEKGMIKFCKDMGLDPESGDVLVVAYHLNCEEMGLFTKEEFVNAFWKSGAQDKKQMKKIISTAISTVKTNEKAFVKFYTWVFSHAKEDKKKKTIHTELAIQLWGIVFTGSQKKKMKYFSDWVEYCEASCEDELKAISKDLWVQICSFLKETKDISTYDDMYGWPVEIDEFVEWLNEKNEDKK